MTSRLGLHPPSSLLRACAFCALGLLPLPSRASVDGPQVPAGAVRGASMEVLAANGAAKAPTRGSSAELYGGSSADRYGGSSADRGGVGGPRDARMGISASAAQKKKLEQQEERRIRKAEKAREEEEERQDQ